MQITTQVMLKVVHILHSQVLQVVHSCSQPNGLSNGWRPRLKARRRWRIRAVVQVHMLRDKHQTSVLWPADRLALQITSLAGVLMHGQIIVPHCHMLGVRVLVLQLYLYHLTASKEGWHLLQHLRPAGIVSPSQRQAHNEYSIPHQLAALLKDFHLQ